MSARQVQVPREFFVKACRDYQDVRCALVREFLQNSRDAHAKSINLVLRQIKDGDRSLVEFQCLDDGDGMSEDVINNKLMALGETTKTAESGAVGGYGVAKIICLMAHESYVIKTRDLVVRGAGGHYTVEKIASQSDFVQGARFTVLLNPAVIYNSAESLEDLYRDEIVKSNLPGITITVNGTAVSAAKKPGRKVHEFEGAGVTIHKRLLPAGERLNNIAVRARGLHMFDLYQHESRYEIMVEMNSYSLDIITSNRDGFKREWRDKINSFVQKLNLDPNFAEKTSVHFYRGMSSRQAPVKAEIMTSLTSAVMSATHQSQGGGLSFDEEAFVAMVGQQLNSLGLTDDSLHTMHDAVSGTVRSVLREKLAAETKEGTKEGVDEVGKVSVASAAAVLSAVADRLETLLPAEVAFRHHYYVETRGKWKKLPTAWEPARFKAKQTKLLELWAKIVGQVLRDVGSDARFDVGFLLDDGSMGDCQAASWRRSGSSSIAPADVFLLNPLTYGREKGLPVSASRRKELIMWLLALAVHEVTHFKGEAWHNESFMMTEADVKQKVYANIDDYLKLRLA